MSVYLLDTDIWSLANENHVQIRTRIAAHFLQDRLLISAVTVDEVISGWLSYVRKARAPDRTEYGYERLLKAIQSFASLELISFSQPANFEFQKLASLKLNVRHNDLRIGAIALIAGATVVTRDLRDFRRIPGLICEDWSV